MGERWIDDKGRLVGRCTYCARVGRAENLRKLPLRYLGDDRDLSAEYCPNCYDTVLKLFRELPWLEEIEGK
jgi:hypothetical protein